MWCGRLRTPEAEPSGEDGEHNDVAGFIIAVVGVIYAVLLAFVVIVSWENFSQAESTGPSSPSASPRSKPAGVDLERRAAEPPGDHVE